MFLFIPLERLMRYQLVPGAELALASLYSTDPPGPRVDWSLWSSVSNKHCMKSVCSQMSARSPERQYQKHYSALQSVEDDRSTLQENSWKSPATNLLSKKASVRQRPTLFANVSNETSHKSANKHHRSPDLGPMKNERINPHRSTGETNPH